MFIIHIFLFSASDVKMRVGDMLFINFIGPEPKSFIKGMAVDVLIIMHQVLLLQCKCENPPQDFQFLSNLPIPVTPTPTPTPYSSVDRLTAVIEADDPSDTGSPTVNT